MDPIVGFFLLGIVATLAGVKLRLPESVFEFISVYLLISIGLKGGVELSQQDPWVVIPQVALIASMGLLLPFVAYPILTRWGHFKKFDAASIAAHYGSVSIGTFAVAIAYLNALEVPVEAHAPLFVVILEVPAILVGIFLAKGRSYGKNWGDLGKEVFLNKSVVLLGSGLLLGLLSNQAMIQKLQPLFFDLFYGFLCFFLLEMGAVAAGEIRAIRQKGIFLLSFGVLMPLFSGCVGIAVGMAAGLSVGGTAIVSVLAASASYIAVPAAMRLSVPEANPALPLGASLGVTFPFNVVLGIPIYYTLSVWAHGLYGLPIK